MAINNLRPSILARAKEIVNFKLSNFSAGYAYINNWTSRTIPQNAIWSSVTRSPDLGRFCAVSTNATNQISLSSDGITWVDYAASVRHSWQSIIWVPKYMRFICVGASSSLVSTKAMYSSDGLNWVTSTTPINDIGYYSVAWADSINTLCAVGKGTECAISTDGGITWTAKTIPTAVGNGGTSDFNKVAYSAKYNRFVAVKIDTFMTSDDGGNTWVQRGNPSTGWITGQTGSITWTSLAWAEELGMFIAIARTSSVSGQLTARSFDGINWTLISVSGAEIQNWQDIVFAPEINLFVAVAGTAGTSAIMTTASGTSLTPWATRTTPASASYRSITWASDLGIFFVSGDRAGAGSGGSMTSLGDSRMRTYIPIYRSLSDT